MLTRAGVIKIRLILLIKKWVLYFHCRKLSTLNINNDFQLLTWLETNIQPTFTCTECTEQLAHFFFVFLFFIFCFCFQTTRFVFKLQVWKQLSWGSGSLNQVTLGFCECIRSCSSYTGHYLPECIAWTMLLCQKIPKKNSEQCQKFFKSGSSQRKLWIFISHTCETTRLFYVA